MSTARSRTPASICVVVTALAVVYTVGVAVSLAAGGAEPSWGYLFQAVIHLGELAGVVALVLSGAAGTGPVARLGFGVAVLGQVLLVAAELIYPGSPAVADPLFSVGPLLSGLGMVLAGIAVLRAGRWTGWHRVVPLVVGIWVFVPMIPAIIVSGGPPAAGALLALAGWDLVWLLLGVAVLAQASVGAPRRAPATP